MCCEHIFDTKQRRFERAGTCASAFELGGDGVNVNTRVNANISWQRGRERGTSGQMENNKKHNTCESTSEKRPLIEITTTPDIATTFELHEEKRPKHKQIVHQSNQSNPIEFNPIDRSIRTASTVKPDTSCVVAGSDISRCSM